MAFKSLMAYLGLDGRNFAQGLSSAEAGAKRAGKKIKDGLAHGAGAGIDFLGEKAGALVGIVALEELARRTMEYGTQVVDMSRRIGISTTAFQEQSFALTETGGKAEDLVGWYEKMGTAREKALSGTKDGEHIKEVFARFGVSGADLSSNKGNEEITKQIGIKIKTSGISIQDVTPELKELGGRGAGVMATAFVAGLEEMGKEANDLGQVMAEEDAKNLKEAKDSLENFGKMLMVSVAPAVAWLGKAFESMVVNVKAAAAYVGALFSGGFSTGLQNILFGGSKSNDAEDAASKVYEEYDARKGAKARSEQQREAAEKAARAQSEIETETKAKEAQAKKLASIQKQINEQERQNHMAGLTKAEKIIALKKEQAEIERKLSDIQDNINLDKLQGKERPELAEEEKQLELELAKRKGEELKDEKVKYDKPDVNSLQKIGAFTAVPESVALAKSQDKHLGALVDLTKQTNVHLQNLGKNKPGSKKGINW